MQPTWPKFMVGICCQVGDHILAEQTNVSKMQRYCSTPIRPGEDRPEVMQISYSHHFHQTHVHYNTYRLSVSHLTKLLIKIKITPAHKKLVRSICIHLTINMALKHRYRFIFRLKMHINVYIISLAFLEFY